MAYLSTGSEWTFDLIKLYDQNIARIAGEFGLDTYPNQIEIITAEQMLDAYASSGLPLGYNHWSYGKHFLASEGWARQAPESTHAGRHPDNRHPAQSGRCTGPRRRLAESDRAVQAAPACTTLLALHATAATIRAPSAAG